MRTETKTHSASSKRSTKSTTNCTPERRRSHAITPIATQHRPLTHPSVRPVGANEQNIDRWNSRTHIKTTEIQVSIANYFEEATEAAHGLIEEVCYAIIAISRAVATIFRLSTWAATLVLAVVCLTVAVGVWAYAAGKKLCSKIFA